MCDTISSLRHTVEEVKKIQKMNYDMLDYLRTQTAWLLDYCEKYNIPLEDIEKAKLFFKRSGKMLEKYSPTEYQQRFKTPDDSTEHISRATSKLYILDRY